MPYAVPLPEFFASAGLACHNVRAHLFGEVPLLFQEVFQTFRHNGHVLQTSHPGTDVVKVDLGTNKQVKGLGIYRPVLACPVTSQYSRWPINLQNITIRPHNYI